MPSTQMDIKGTIEWAKVFESNRDQNEWNVETNGEYKVTVITDKKTAKSLVDAGCKKKRRTSLLREQHMILCEQQHSCFLFPKCTRCSCKCNDCSSPARDS